MSVNVHPLRLMAPLFAAVLLDPSCALAKPLVRVLIPLVTAADYQRVKREVRGAPLTALDGQAFLVAASLDDARQAYQLGRSLQKRLGLPFELLYDDGHPQADLSWFKQPLHSSPPPLPDR